MVKTYELVDRHFGWPPRPRAATEAQTLDYLLDRALRAQGVVSLNSICYMDAPRKKAMAALIEARVRRRQLVPVAIDGRKPHWATPEALAEALPETDRVHILSPFDPLVIQRKRLASFFDYDHRFEAYVPAAKRQLGYFALPVLVGDRVAAAIDLKADRAAAQAPDPAMDLDLRPPRGRQGPHRRGSRPVRGLPVRPLTAGARRDRRP